MPKDLYRWEDGGALVHHCPVCQSPLSHDKSRQTCVGRHVECCNAYHTQLFKFGHSSECMACIKTDKERQKRHRDIAGIIHQIDRACAAASELDADRITPSSPIWTPPDKSLSKRERKAKNKATKRAQQPPAAVTSLEIEAVSKAIKPDLGAMEVFAHNSIGTFDAEFQENLNYHRGTSNTRETRLRMIGQPRQEEAVGINEDHEHGTFGEIDMQVELVMQRLGLSAFPNQTAASFAQPEKSDVKSHRSSISTTASCGSASIPAAVNRRISLPHILIPNEETRKLLTQTRQAIKEDLVHDRNDAREQKERKAGFWRWANKKIYERMIANGAWSNGKKEQAMAHAIDGEPPKDAFTDDVDGAVDEDLSLLDLQKLLNDEHAVTSSTEPKATAKVLHASTKAEKKPDLKLKFSSNGGLKKLSATVDKESFFAAPPPFQEIDYAAAIVGERPSWPDSRDWIERWNFGSEGEEDDAEV